MTQILWFLHGFTLILKKQAPFSLKISVSLNFGFPFFIHSVHALQGSVIHLVSWAVVTSDHKLHSLKQHTFILLQFWSSEVQHGSHWPTSVCWQGCVSSVACHWWLLEATPFCGHWLSFLVSRASSLALSAAFATISLVLFCLLFCF